MKIEALSAGRICPRTIFRWRVSFHVRKTENITSSPSENVADNASLKCEVDGESSRHSKVASRNPKRSVPASEPTSTTMPSIACIIPQTSAQTLCRRATCTSREVLSALHSLSLLNAFADESMFLLLVESGEIREVINLATKFIGNTRAIAGVTRNSE